jgi:solute carrier family 13 (sodium-dependent dicarboxylate transporter), member 2/3/5
MKYSYKDGGLVLGLIVFFILLIFPVSDEPVASRMAAIAVLMGIWWMTEALPLAATSLVPLLLFPLLGIINATETAKEYFNSTIAIYIGGFLIALSMQRWDLHRRLALKTILVIGKGPSGIVLGFMIASAFISMLISNVATTVMLLPIGMAIILKVEESFKSEITKKFSISLMLGIAYAASIGGVATLIGTAPNLIFKRIYEMNFPEAGEITFGSWFLFGFPIAMIMLALAWIVLTKILYKPSPELVMNNDVIREEYKLLGKMAFEEKMVAIIAGMTAILWLTRTNLEIGELMLPGWGQLLPFGDMIDDATIAIFSGLLLFILPAKKRPHRLSQDTVFMKIPWDVILIFGGGFALAKGFTVSGLSEVIGSVLTGITDIHPLILTLTVCLLLTFLTELTSNTATTNTVLPILAAAAIAGGINPLYLMLPATLSASFAFMLPVATPPNAIVYGSGKIKVEQMMKAGIVLNLIGVLVITGMFKLFGTSVFGN